VNCSCQEIRVRPRNTRRTPIVLDEPAFAYSVYSVCSVGKKSDGSLSSMQTARGGYMNLICAGARMPGRWIHALAARGGRKRVAGTAAGNPQSARERAGLRARSTRTTNLGGGGGCALQRRTRQWQWAQIPKRLGVKPLHLERSDARTLSAITARRRYCCASLKTASMTRAVIGSQ
jgi:hypothetical protein